MDAGSVNRRLIEAAQGPGKGQIGIPDTQCCRFNLRKIRIDQNSRGVRFARQRAVLGVGYEGHLGGAGFLNSFDASNFQICVTAQLRAQSTCQFA
jgi:hypothetical protein